MARTCSTSPVGSARSSTDTSVKIPQRIAPAVRSRRVSALVSTPAMPTTPCRAISAGSEVDARQFDGRTARSRTTKPDTQIRADSSSSCSAEATQPVLPICGAVAITTWRRYDGSVRVSW